MLTREAMTAHAEWIAPDLSLTETAVRMRDNNIGCLPQERAGGGTLAAKASDPGASF